MIGQRDPKWCAAALCSMMFGCFPDSFDLDRDGFYAPGKDCDDSQPGVSPTAVEVCDGVDNDCDGQIDEDVLTVFWADSDGDGAGDPEVTEEACAPSEGFVDNDLDCDDASAAVRTGLAESCDGVDNDCDGDVDEDDALDASVWFFDGDGDGFGDTLVWVQACAAPDGYVAVDGDCDDADADISPSGIEVCNERDDDCDGNVDEADAEDATIWYIDWDGDGYGSATSTVVQCLAPRWYVDNDLDCDDTSRSVFPGQTERCDGVDNDCDGTTDEPDAEDVLVWFEDADGDGYGDATSTTSACSEPTGYVGDDSDCDDASADIHPLADERCNGSDDDCDGTVDESDAVDAAVWYADADGDGYGDGGVLSVACSQPSGSVADASDCDDGDAAVSPAEAEVCNNGVDDDCDGTANGCPLSGTLGSSDADGAASGLATSAVGAAVANHADLSGDGLADVLVGDPDAHTAWLWTGSGGAGVDLSATPIALSGGADAAGTSVLLIDDVDGDGYGSLLVGSPDSDQAAAGAGAVWLLHGPVTGDTALADGDARLLGTAGGTGAGLTLAHVGDTVGDGATELAIGGDDRVWIIPGGVSGPMSLGNADAVVVGDVGVGTSVVGAQDIDGDGLNDLAMGDPSIAGAVRVFYGPLMGSIDAADADAVWTGATDGDGLGQSVAAFGDADGDGYADLAAGAPGDRTGGVDAGAVFVFAGPMSGGGGTSADAAAVIVGAAGDMAGWSVATGDPNGDDAVDLLIGLPGSATAGAGSGAVSLTYGPVSSGSTAAADVIIEGSVAGEALGHSLSAGGDVDGDAYGDVVLGAPDSGGTGATYLFLGRGL